MLLLLLKWIVKFLFIFQMLKIGEDYTPTISNHILGKVASYNMEEQSMKLTVLGDFCLLNFYIKTNHV